jgi:hypothetical protein
MALYQGALPFLITYVTFVGFQFTIYEVMMKHYKTKHGEQKFNDNKMKYNLISSLFGGCIAAAITNPLECITVNKQTSNSFSMKEFVK